MNSKYVISFGMSNYLLYGGGTNMSTIAYQYLYNEDDISFVCITPYLLHGKKCRLFRQMWNVIIDGKEIAVCSTNNLIKFLTSLESIKPPISIDVHHLKNVEFDDFVRVTNQFNCRINFFVHDYSTVCTNFTLLDSELKYCGDKGIYKSVCNKCQYYGEAKKVISKYVGYLYENYDKLNIIFPSDVAKEVWLSAYPQFADKTVVIPHQVKIGKYTQKHNVCDDQKIKVAFIGSCEEYKGWKIFNKLKNEIANACRYEWYYFGTADVGEEYKKIYVDTTKDKKAMVIALRKEEINCVILWSVCKETYSYTYFESLSANAFVVTNKFSGNIAKEVEKNGNGIVLNDEQDLLCLFNTYLPDMIYNFNKSDIYGPMELIPNKQLIPNFENKRNELIQMPKVKKNIIGIFLFAVDRMHMHIKNHNGG